MYVLPIIFIILFIIAIIVMSIYLKNNKISIRITGILIPAILLILVIIYFIYLIIIPNILIEVDDNHLYYKDYKIGTRVNTASFGFNLVINIFIKIFSLNN